MDRPTFVKKLEVLLDEFETNRTFGTVEICFNSGQPQLIRKLTTEKIYSDRETTHGRPNIERR